MNSPLSLIPQWMPTDHGPDEIRQTSCLFRISLRNRLVTRIDDDWARSVRDTVRLSCYPLALWFAASWWRLCCEPTPETHPDIDWYMSHAMPSAGHGFLWPPVQFESDGERVTITCTPSSVDSTEPIRYLSHCHESITISEFMDTIGSFIQMVLDRLETVGILDTELHQLWREVTEERADTQVTSYRKMEALLGLDPDDASESIAMALQRLSAQAGEAAAAEVAAACSHRDSIKILAHIEEMAHSQGVQGDFSGITNLRKNDFPYQPEAPPWDRGRDLARAIRKNLGIGEKTVPDTIMCDMSGITARDLTNGDTPMAHIPLSLAILNEDNQRVNMLFRSRNRHGRRFGLARWMADALMVSDQDRWFVATGAKMARQKVQRAFAAEFLAPIEALQAFLENDITDEDRVEEAAEYFNVSFQTVKSQLANHGLISSETMNF